MLTFERPETGQFKLLLPTTWAGQRDLFNAIRNLKSEDSRTDNVFVLSYGSAERPSDCIATISGERSGAVLLTEVEHAGGRMLRRGEFTPGLPYAYVVDPDGYEIEI